MDVTALQPERHVVEREHAGKALRTFETSSRYSAPGTAPLCRTISAVEGLIVAMVFLPYIFRAGIPGGWRRCFILIGGLEARWEVPRPQAPRLVRRRSRGLAVDQFLFMNWSMLAGVTSWKGM